MPREVRKAEQDVKLRDVDVSPQAWPCLRVLGATALIVLALALPIVAAAGFHIALKQLGPLPKAMSEPVSVVVLDRKGSLLRPFANRLGRWRLPVGPDQVDPRYLEMLLSYEDKRFYSHRGIDPLALARAAVQLVGVV